MTCYEIKKKGKCRSCAYIELLMHLGGLLSTQEARVALGYRLERLLAYASFVLSNLQSAP